MKKSSRSQEHIQKAFSSFCTKALTNEAKNFHKKEMRRMELFSDIPVENLPQEENMFDTCANYLTDSSTEKIYSVAGKIISSEMIAEALKCLSDEQQNLILQYFFYHKTDKQIAEMLNISQSTVQRHRISSIRKIKECLEENANEKKHK
ncbi:MAG: sigma-70 family RNA polymerase sigma factor [Clostridiales bacterium]|nr:sigma-70 family RNA polymerase sigma factor [Clostridiales bacterium]